MGRDPAVDRVLLGEPGALGSRRSGRAQRRTTQCWFHATGRRSSRQGGTHRGCSRRGADLAADLHVPVVASLVDGSTAGAEEFYATLLQAKWKPHVLDDVTVVRSIKAFEDAADDVWLFEEQLTRWAAEPVTAEQRAEVVRLMAQIPRWRQAVDPVLTLAHELESQTIESVLAKSDLELGIEWLLGQTR